MDEGADYIMADTLIPGTTLVEKESRSIGDVPIGGIVSWAKTLSGVPNLAEGWVEGSGQTLSDALSPLNGQTIPDLNGDNRFLRGNSTSGGIGGVDDNNHSHNTNDSNRGDTGSLIPVVETLVTKTLDNKPPFYNVVWIMRVR